jgi:hypothetical protein
MYCCASVISLAFLFLAQSEGHEALKALYAHADWRAWVCNSPFLFVLPAKCCIQDMIHPIHIPHISHPLLAPELDEASDVFHKIPNADATFHYIMLPQTHFQAQSGLVTLIKRSYRHLEVSGQKGGACMRFFDTKIVRDLQESRHGNSHTEIPSSEFKHGASLRTSFEAWRVSLCS